MVAGTRNLIDIIGVFSPKMSTGQWAGMASRARAA